MIKKCFFIIAIFSAIAAVSLIRIQPASASSIWIISPNGGEYLSVSSTYQIKWISSSDVAYTGIFLMKEGGGSIQIATGVYNYGISGGEVYDWYIPSNIASGRYKINITGEIASDGSQIVSAFDESDNFFTISNPTTACGPYSDLVVTGSTSGGSIWGSNPYTDDSDFNKAALHAGLISAGQTATIRKTNAGYLYNFTGSTFNGVTTLPWTTGWCGVNISFVSFVATPYLTLNSPNGGENWTIGETKRVSWGIANINYVRIYIEDASGAITGSGSVNYIYDGAIPISTSYFDWTIQKSQLPGSNLTFPRNYKIRIDGVNSTETGAQVVATDRSDNSFTIREVVTPSLSVAYPNGGETLIKGQTYTFRWTSQNMSGKNVRVALYQKDLTPPLFENIAGITSADSGWVSWAIPSSIVSKSNYYKIAVIYDSSTGGVAGESVADYSDNFFSILDTETPVAGCLPDGSLVKLPEDPKVYIIINCQKKWIQTTQEFNQGGYSWSSVQETIPSALQSYTDYVQLLKATSDEKVYKIIGGKKLWIPTSESFANQGFNWSQVQEATKANIDKYARAKLVRVASSPNVYYLTEAGRKRHILNSEVFLSYDNKWEDVVEITAADLEMYPDSVLIRAEGDKKVFVLIEGKKQWIKTAEAFNQLALDWNNIAPVNTTELNAYPEGAAIE